MGCRRCESIFAAARLQPACAVRLVFGIALSGEIHDALHRCNAIILCLLGVLHACRQRTRTGHVEWNAFLH